jgi:hypothetical protein
MKNYILYLLLSFQFNSICNAQGISINDFIINSTIKIESIDKIIDSGKVKRYRSSGTGFFFTFNSSKGNIPVIVTNKHVIKDSEKGILYFKTKDTTGLPNYNKIEKIEIDKFKERWILHPDTSVDIAILPIAPILNTYLKMGKPLFYFGYEEQYIPNDSIRNTICSIEDILMIGYPFGLRDTKNDLPIIRRGVTATPAYLNFNSLQEFLIDMSVYPGSSGSPVVIYNPMTFTTRNGGFYMKGRLILLGINYATYARDFEGKIIPKASYNIEDSLIVKTPIPYNIGIVIKAERLLEFKSLLATIK